MLINTIKEKLNKWRDISCLWIGRTNIVKIFSIFRFSAIPIKMPASTLCILAN